MKGPPLTERLRNAGIPRLYGGRRPKSTVVEGIQAPAITLAKITVFVL
jgi:hypothetical protein